jgi:transposase
VIPSIFAYGRARDSQEIVDRALAFLEAIDPEVNTITSEWKSAGIRSESAFFSQALLQLRNNYCKKRRCLDCMIGSRLVSQGKVLRNDEELMLEP